MVALAEPGIGGKERARAERAAVLSVASPRSPDSGSASSGQPRSAHSVDESLGRHAETPGDDHDPMTGAHLAQKCGHAVGSEAA